MGNLKTIHIVAANAQKINFDAIVRDSIEETKSTIVSLNKLNLRQGFKVDGTRIGQYASIPYAAKKYNQSGEAGFGFIDLYLTGAWSDSIGIIVNSKSFSTFSTDFKAPKLELDYGKNIYGLPDAKKSNYVEVLAPVIIKRTKAQLFASI